MCVMAGPGHSLYGLFIQLMLDESVAFESSRASFPMAAACRVKWIDMHYLITCLLCHYC